MTFSDYTELKNGFRIPTTLDNNDVMRGVMMKRHNDVIFSKIVWRCPLRLHVDNHHASTACYTFNNHGGI